MSEENAGLAYRAFTAINRRDLDGFLALMDDDVEAVSRLVAIEGGLHGHEGIRRWWQEWFNVFPDYEVEVVDIRDRGDVILAALRSLGHGAGSDVPFDTIWLASRWRAGRCVWWRVSYSWDEALDAAGLRE
jgi:ketosteroid isomerase-like protein